MNFCAELSRGLEFDELAFTLEPADTIALRDKPLILHCVVQTSVEGGLVNVQWMKDGVPVALNSRR